MEVMSDVCTIQDRHQDVPAPHVPDLGPVSPSLPRMAPEARKHVHHLRLHCVAFGLSMDLTYESDSPTVSMDAVLALAASVLQDAGVTVSTPGIDMFMDGQTHGSIGSWK